MRPLMRFASASAAARVISVSMTADGVPLSLTSFILSTGANALSASRIPSSVTSPGRLAMTIRIGTFSIH
jgi:hypothetical protein